MERGAESEGPESLTKHARRFVDKAPLPQHLRLSAPLRPSGTSTESATQESHGAGAAAPYRKHKPAKARGLGRWGLQRVGRAGARLTATS